MNRICISCSENLTEPDWLGSVELFTQKILELLKKDCWELSILLCDDKFIQQLNNDYRNIDSPTDILSFEDGSEYFDDNETWFTAGDIAISIETLEKNASYFAVTTETELVRLLIHGILHLSGMDHGECHISVDGTFEGGTDEDKKMLELQESILSQIKNEYFLN